MCDKIGLFNFYFKVLIIHYYSLLYDERKNAAKYHKILLSRFWEIVFCVPILFGRHNCLSNLQHAPSRKLPLTARKTVFNHLKLQ